MAIVPTPETGKQITDYTAGTFDGNSLIYQSRNGQGYKISGDDIGTYTVGQQVHSGLGNKTIKQYVDSEISALPEPMIFKGTLGTGGTIQTLPTATSANEGFTYKVITDGTYAGQTAKVGDVFTSDGSTWVLIPAGDDVEDTWRNIKVNGTEILGSAISTGALDLKAGTNISLSNNGGEVTINNTAPSYTEVSGTLTAGATTLTLSDASITATSTIEVYTDIFGAWLENMVVSTGSVVLTFEAQSTNMAVKVRVS